MRRLVSSPRIDNPERHIQQELCSLVQSEVRRVISFMGELRKSKGKTLIFEGMLGGRINQKRYFVGEIGGEIYGEDGKITSKGNVFETDYDLTQKAYPNIRRKNIKTVYASDFPITVQGLAYPRKQEHTGDYRIDNIFIEEDPLLLECLNKAWSQKL